MSIAVARSRTQRWACWMAVALVAGATLCGCARESRGRAVYESEACPQCHGIDLRGSERGPSLRDISTIWTREELKKYIADPRAYLVSDERLRSMVDRYAVQMPALRIEDRRLDELVDYLITQE